MHNKYFYIENEFNIIPSEWNLSDISDTYYTTNNGCFAFNCVGIFINREYSVIIFPKNYHLPHDEKTMNKEITNLLKTIRRYNRKFHHFSPNSDSFHTDNVSSDSYIVSMMNIIEYYLNNGLLFDTENRLTYNQGAKIDWNSTIKKTLPTHINNTPFYLNTYSKKRYRNYDSDISLLNKFALCESFEKLGFLYDINYDDEPMDRILLQDFQYQHEKYRYKLERIIESTYDSNLLELLFSIQSVLFFSNKANNTKNTISFVTKNFELVWEDVISVCFGNQFSSFSKTFPSLDVVFNNTIEKHAQIPDTIYYDDTNSEWIIVDAKYYDVDVSRPGKGDFLKQFFYEFSFHHSKNVKYNILVFNYYGNLFTYLGYANITNATDPFFKDKYVHMVGLNQAIAYDCYANNLSQDQLFRTQLYDIININEQ